MEKNKEYNYTAFMIMPFGKKSCDAAYELLNEICLERKIRLLRSDQIPSNLPFHNMILEGIEGANLVFADITGSNGNVMYELGYAHAKKQESTIVYTSDPYHNIPSDIRHINIIQYEDSIEGGKKFKFKVTQLIDNLLSNSMEFYQQQFEIYLSFLRSTSKIGQVYVILALNYFITNIEISKEIAVEGENEDGSRSFYTASNPLKEFRALFDNSLLKIANDKITLSNKGMLFAKYLDERNFKVCFFNGEQLQQDCIPLFEKLKSKYAKREINS